MNESNQLASLLYIMYKLHSTLAFLSRTPLLCSYIVLQMINHLIHYGFSPRKKKRKPHHEYRKLFLLFFNQSFTRMPDYRLLYRRAHT